MSRMFCFLREFRWFSEISLHANTRTHSHKWSTRNHRQNVCMVLVLFLLILIVRLFSLSSSSFCTSFYGGYLNVKELERWFGLAIECNNAWLCSHQSSLAVSADTCVCVHWFWALKYMLAHKPASWLSCRFDTEYLLSASSECKTGHRCTVYIVLCLRFKNSNLQKIMWYSISIHTLNCCVCLQFYQAFDRTSIVMSVCVCLCHYTTLNATQRQVARVFFFNCG